MHSNNDVTEQRDLSVRAIRSQTTLKTGFRLSLNIPLPVVEVFVVVVIVVVVADEPVVVVTEVIVVAIVPTIPGS